MSSGSSSPPSYEPLHGKEDRDSIDGLDMLPLHRARSSPRRSNAIKAVKIISALILVAFIVLTFALSFHAVDLLGKIGHLINEPKPASHQRSYKYPCGQSAAEAKEKGCIFDIMSMAWSVYIPIPTLFKNPKPHTIHPRQAIPRMLRPRPQRRIHGPRSLEILLGRNRHHRIDLRPSFPSWTDFVGGTAVLRCPLYLRLEGDASGVAAGVADGFEFGVDGAHGALCEGAGEYECAVGGDDDEDSC